MIYCSTLYQSNLILLHSSRWFIHPIWQPRARSTTNRAADKSKNRIQSILQLLGPAIHPSECAFRSIGPVTKGPVRGHILPVASTNSNPLEELTRQHPVHVEQKQDAVFGALESGRSRFDSSNDDIIALLSMESTTQNDCSNRGMMMNLKSLKDDTTFVDTMKIVYTQGSSNDHANSPGPNQNDYEKENALKTQIWSQHISNLHMPKSIYLQHEPEDLNTIYRLKSLRSSTETNFADEITKTFTPQLNALRDGNTSKPMAKTRKGYAVVGSISDSSAKISTRPSIDPISQLITDSTKKLEYSSRLNKVPFTQFLSGEYVDMDEQSVRTLHNVIYVYDLVNSKCVTHKSLLRIVRVKQKMKMHYTN